MVRQINERRTDSLTVELFYQCERREIWLSVLDTKSGIDYLGKVPSEKARDAFLHPFCYIG